MQLAGSTSAPKDFQSCFACLSTYSCLGNALEETRVVVVASRLSPIGFTSFKLQSTRGWRWDMSVAAQCASGYSRCFRRHVRSDLDVRAFNGLANDIQLSFWQTQPGTLAQSKVHPVFLITYVAEFIRCPGERYALGISMRKSCPPTLASASRMQAMPLQYRHQVFPGFHSSLGTSAPLPCRMASCLCRYRRRS